MKHDGHELMNDRPSEASRKTSPCIYCKCTHDPSKGAGDHIIPAAMGEFAELRRFRLICAKCNNLIGKSEAQLLRCGPEAILARIANPPRRRHRDGKEWRGAEGAPPPALFNDNYGVRLVVQPLDGDPRNVETVDQLVVEDEHGAQNQIRFFPGMTAEAVRSKIDKLDVGKKKMIRHNVSEENSPEIRNLLEELCPGEKVKRRSTTEIGVRRSRGLVRFKVTDHYFRALAKIAFHYYLCYGQSGSRGDEPQFNDVRRFILEGGNPEHFFMQPSVYSLKSFIDSLPCHTITSSHWLHILTCDNSKGSINVELKLFAHPDNLSVQPYFIRLGSSPSADKSSGACGHLLVWEKGSISKGHVLEIPVARNA